MTPWMRDLAIADLPPLYQEIAALAGDDAALACLRTFAGCNVDFPRAGADQLTASAAELASAIGQEAAARLAAHFAGCRIYFPQPPAAVRNAWIRARFDGTNYRALARATGLTERRIRIIIATRPAAAPTRDDRQMALFEGEP